MPPNNLKFDCCFTENREGQLVRQLGDTGLSVLFEWNAAAAKRAEEETFGTEASYYNLTSPSHLHS